MAVRRRVAATAVAASLAALMAAGAVLALRSDGRQTSSAPSVVPVPATAPPVRPRPARSWVAVENHRPGTGGWRITHAGPADAVQGWADQVSAAAGDRVRLYVSTTARRFQVKAYRMGWYGGRGGRLVWRSEPLPGRRQPSPVRTPGTNMIATHWRPSVVIPIGPAWLPGVYLLKLVAATGQRYVPLTVRDDTGRAALVVQDAVTTWQAYNRWGGRSLYLGPDGSLATRSRVVSFDRPYAAEQGAGDFLGNELPLVRLVESLGLDVTYWTDVDLHRHPERLLAHRALVSLGHDEYRSTRMRRGAEAARRGGGPPRPRLGVAPRVARGPRAGPRPRGQPGLPGRQRRLPAHPAAALPDRPGPPGGQLQAVVGRGRPGLEDRPFRGHHRLAPAAPERP